MLVINLFLCSLQFDFKEMASFCYRELDYFCCRAFYSLHKRNVETCWRAFGNVWNDVFRLYADVFNVLYHIRFLYIHSRIDLALAKTLMSGSSSYNAFTYENNIRTICQDWKISKQHLLVFFHGLEEESVHVAWFKKMSLKVIKK